MNSQTIIWFLPGRLICISDYENHSSDSPLPKGSKLRFGNLLGIVTDVRKHEELLLHRNSVMVHCSDNTNQIWFIPSCNILSGQLYPVPRKIIPKKFPCPKKVRI